MKILISLFVLLVTAKRPEVRKRRLSPTCLTAFHPTLAIQGEMQDMFFQLESTGTRKDFSASAAGVAKWIDKMKKEFEKKCTLCGDGYWLRDER